MSYQHTIESVRESFQSDEWEAVYDRNQAEKKTGPYILSVGPLGEALEEDHWYANVVLETAAGADTPLYAEGSWQATPTSAMSALLSALSDLHLHLPTPGRSSS